MTKYFVDTDGNYLGGFDGVKPPQGAIEVPSPPAYGLDKWVNGAWVAYIAPPSIESIAQTIKDMVKVIPPTIQIRWPGEIGLIGIYLNEGNLEGGIGLFQALLGKMAEANDQEALAAAQPIIAYVQALNLQE